MIELNPDQRRELVNTRQRHAARRDAGLRHGQFRGSMVWSATKGIDYLLRSEYQRPGAPRRQRSLGPRSAHTEELKRAFDEGRAAAAARVKELDQVMVRQAAINRALALGRVPPVGARIVRVLDDAGLLGRGIRIVGTNALFAYEAAAGVMLDSAITTTEDIDLLLDARAGLRLSVSGDVAPASLMALLRRADRSFERSARAFRAVNGQGYTVDLIAPMREPPWQAGHRSLGAGSDDLEAMEIEGLSWLENSPEFETVAIDQNGAPVRMVTADPRAFAIHKHWLSLRADRDPVRRERDRAQAAAVARLVGTHLQHLAFDPAELLMIPRDHVQAAERLFDQGA